MQQALRTVVLLLLVYTIAPTTADVDLWGHLRFGADIVATGAIPRSDPRAFTSDRPWINHEWLAECAMALAYREGGVTGLALLRICLVGLMALMVWAAAREHARTAGSDLLVGLVIILTLPRAQHMRPQLFSFVLMAALLLVLTRADRGHRKALLIVAPILALWTNLHGGWIIGFATVMLWLAIDALRHRDSRIVPDMLLGAVSGLATLVNPYGVELWRFLWQTVGVGRPDIEEWLPITQARPGVLLLWLVTAVIATIACVLRRPRPPVSSVVVVASLGVFSARVARLDAFFAIATVMLLAPQVAGMFVFKPSGARLTAPRGHSPAGAWTVAVVTIVLAGLIVAWKGRTIDLSAADWLPEPEAASFISAHRLHGRMITWFDWGEYALWQFEPGLGVSMDGRRETIYSNRVIAEHYQLYGGRRQGLDYVRPLHPDYAWLPKRLPAVAALEREGWGKVFEGPVSVVLAKNDASDLGLTRVVVGPSRPRRFPGP